VYRLTSRLANRTVRRAPEPDFIALREVKMTAHHGVRAPDTSGTLRRGPLASVRIVEFAGIGPVPYGAMLLADLGADVIRIDRPGGYPAPEASLKFEEMGPTAIFNRSRRTVRVDLKSSAGRELILRLVSNCDALIESYRPGTMERLGLGPSHCFAINPRLAYVRTTGWGQTGALANAPGSTTSAYRARFRCSKRMARCRRAFRR
jgi:crotonobetainyl-CoA:carnitine CoA-transferase CaiB-like acyl-CoA transferase